MKAKTAGTEGILFIVLACVAWSFSGLLGKWAPWGALSLMGARALIATIALALRRKSLRLTHNKGTWLGSFAVMATSLLFLMANKLTTSANAIVIQYAMPAVVILLSWLIFKEQPGKVDLVATALVMLGVALCFVSSLGHGNLLGDTLALISAFTYALVMMAARFPHTNPTDFTYQGNLLSCLFLFVIPFDPQVTLTPTALVAVLLMGLSLSAGYVFFVMGMSRGVSPVSAAIVSNIEPVLNPLWVLLALGERPGLLTVIGALFVLCAVTGYSLMTSGRFGKKSLPPVEEGA